MSKHKVTFCTIVLLTVSLMLIASVAAQEVQRGGTLVISMPSSPRLLDPPITGCGEEWLVTLGTYNNLTLVDRNFKVQPDLARSWESNREATEWTFHLYEGAEFHHGREVTADDVVFSVNRILDPKTGSRGRGALGPIAKVEAVGKYSVRFVLSMPVADFPANLAEPYVRITPKEKVDELNTKAYGTGPFKLQEFIVGEKAVLVRNDRYFRKGFPYLDKIILQAYPDSYSEINALQSGAVDIMWQVRAAQVPLVEKMPNVIISEIPTGAYTPIVMRSDKPPFDNLLVRQAMKMVFDRNQIVQTIIKGHGVLGNDQPLPPNNPFYHKQAIPKRNIKMAKELLIKAGYPKGLKLTMQVSDAREGMLELALITKEMAKDAGFDIDIVKLPWDVFLNTIWEKETFYVNNWFARSTTDASIRPFFSTKEKGGTLNEYHYSDPRVDELLALANGELDNKRRAELYAKAEEIISKEGPAIITYFKNQISAYNKRVQGYSVHPSMWYIQPMERLWIKR